MLFLGGCSNSSNSSSSRNDNSSTEEEEEKTQPKKCKVENGIAKLKDGECKITACNAGYDDHDGDGDCEVTASRFYSPAGSSTRTDCSTVSTPSDAMADITSTGLSSANECWACDRGFDDH